MMKDMSKFWVLFSSLFLLSSICIASVPNEITLGDITYFKADENVMGNHKSAEYIQKGETKTNWTSKFAIHYYVNERDPVQFAKNLNGSNANIVDIDGNKNNIMQMFDTMIPVDNSGGPIIFQQNAWRFEKLNYDKGIVAIEYAKVQGVASQAKPQDLQSINTKILNEMKTMQINQFEF